MSSRRRRKRSSGAPAAGSDGAPAAGSDGDAAAKSAPREPRQRSKGQKRSGLGRGFWVYFAVMMAVLIPLQFVFAQQCEQDRTRSADIQPVALLGSIDEPHDPYETDPPTSGPHVAELAEPGFRDGTIPDEVQVANLADGYVIVHYNARTGPTLEAGMRRLAAELEGWDLIVQPDATLDPETQVVLTAWGRLERLDQFDADARRRIRRFVQTFSGLEIPTATASPG